MTGRFFVRVLDGAHMIEQLGPLAAFGAAVTVATILEQREHARTVIVDQRGHVWRDTLTTLSDRALVRLRHADLARLGVNIITN